MSFLDDLLGEVTAALGPLIDAATDPWLLDQLLEQVAVDAAELQASGFVAQLTAIGQAASDLQALIEEPPETLAAVGTALDATQNLVKSVRALANGTPSGTEQLASDLVQLVVLRYLAHRWPLGYQIGIAAGFIDSGLTRSGGLVRVGMPTDVVVWSAFEQFFAGPKAVLRGHFSAQPLATVTDANTTMDTAVERFGGLASALGMPWRYGYAPEDAAALGEFAPRLEHAVLLLAPPSWVGDGDPLGVVITLSSADQDDLGVVLAPFGSFTIERDLTAWHLSLTGSAELQAIALGGGTGFQVLATNGAVDAALDLTLTQAPLPDAAPYIIGTAQGTRLELSGTTAHAKIEFAATGHRVDVGVDVPQAVFVLTADGADGFLASVFDNRELRAAIDFGLAYTSAAGLHLKNGSGLTAQIPVALSVGPLSLRGVSLSAAPTAQAIEVGIGTTVGVTLGPVAVTVHGLGMRARATLPSATPPTTFDIDFGVRPPDGAGLSVDASGVVTGGGFLFYNEAASLYAGAMQLSIHESITVKAFGLITTRMPDGSPGVSLIVFITVEDFRPIPLGLGFMLLGIGGMVAVNRTFDQEVIRQGLASGTLATLLFPRDPVGEAPTLIRNLAAAFPARQGSYLLGLLARIGWFTPTLVLMDLALILEFGSRQRLLALGRISALLPSADNDLVRLNMEAVGVIDFDAGTAAVDAVLVDSRLAHKFPITGAAALRAGFGAGPSFVLAVGGFNPRFAPPPNVPALARLAIALSSGDNPRLICQAYFAITSNTVQFGARAALYASAAGFSVEGEVGFDVLVQLIPLQFIAEFVARLELKRGSHNLFMVKLSGALQGPRPLRVSGKATFEILWCDFTVRFDTTLVSGERPPLPPAINVLAQLVDALGLPSSWRTQPGATETHGVALRSLPPAGAGAPIVLDPLGRILVSQQVVPLNTDIDIFGGAPVAGARHFSLTAVLDGTLSPNGEVLEGTPLDGPPHQEPFAPAQFVAMTDDEKLSAPSFVSMDAGAVFGAAGVLFDEHEIIAAPLDYGEPVVITLDGAPALVPDTAAPAPYTLTTPALQTWTGSGAAARAALRRGGRARFANQAAEPGATFAPNRWVILPIGDGQLGDGQPYLVDPSVRTWSDHQHLVTSLNRGGARWQLVPAHEIPGVNPDA